jgi:hypothetical protein
MVRRTYEISRLLRASVTIQGAKRYATSTCRTPSGRWTRNLSSVRFVFFRLRNDEFAGSCAESCAGCLGLIILVAVVLVGVGVLVGVTAPR